MKDKKFELWATIIITAIVIILFLIFGDAFWPWFIIVSAFCLLLNIVISGITITIKKK